VLAVVFVIWLLPTFVGHTPLVSWIASRAAADVNGRVEVQSASLGWFSPVRLYGLKIVDQDNNPVVEVPEVHGDRALTAMIWNAANMGRFRLEGPKFTVVLRDNGSNVEEIFAKYLVPREKKKIDLAVEIVDGSVSIEDARLQRTWQIDKFALDFAMPADRSRPMELKTSGLVAGPQRGGSFDLAMRVQQVQRDGDGAVAVGSGLNEAVAVGSGLNESAGSDAASGPDTISLKTEGLSLAVLDPFIRRAVPGLRMAGRLSAGVECRWDSRRPDSRATLQTSIVADELKLAGPMFGSDQPSLSRLRVDGAMAWQNGVVQFDRVTTESELGSLSLSGTIDASGARAASRQGYEVNGQLDLVRLAAILPDTLRIQKNTRITSGRVQLGLTARPGQEGMAWKGKLEVSNLVANNGGRSVVWQQPVTLTLAAKETAQGPVIETLKCDSSFLKVHASGTPSQLTGNATFDASKLSEQLRGFVDLAGTRLAGDGWAELNWKRNADGAFDAGAKFRLNGFQWAVPDRPAWTEDALTLTVSATGRADSTRNRIDTAVVKLESDRDLVEVRLVEPVADFRGGSPISLEVHSQGLLTRWPGRLALWFPSMNWTAGGSFDLVTGATISETGIALRQFRFTADNLQWAGPKLAVREPKAELTLAGRWDGKTRRLELESAGLSCATLEAKANRFVCAIPPRGPVELSGTVTYQAALDRIRGWTAVDPKKPPSWRMAGRLGGKAEFQQSGGLISGRVDGQVTDLEITHSSDQRQRYQEREVRFVGQGNYNDVSRLVHIEQAELTSATVRCALAGKIVNVGSQPDLQLAGRIDYDMDRLSQFIRSMAGDGVRLGGRGSSTVSHQGVWGSDAAVASGKLGWTWAQLYGFQLGAGELQASLSKGVFEVRPLDLECSEGRLRVAPQFKIAQEPREITLNAGRVVDRVRISPEMCKTLLQYMAPLLAGVTSAEGRFSIDLEGFRLPLAGQSKLAGASSSSAVKWSEAEIAGKLVIHSAQVGPGSLIQELAKLFGRTTPAYLIQESTIPFRMTKGRIYHQQMDLVFNEVKLRTYGSVGLDQSLAMMIEMPIPPKWQTGKILGPALKDQIIKLPIGGYLGQPKIDRSAFDQIAKQFFQNATQTVIKNRLGELLGPLPKR
jgi:hypothetical protein